MVQQLLACIGEAVVQQLFSVSQGSRKVPVVGCRCTKGLLHRKKLFKVIRNDAILYSGLATCVHLYYCILLQCLLT
jgi:hypothetical protein